MSAPRTPRSDSDSDELDDDWMRSLVPLSRRRSPPGRQQRDVFDRVPVLNRASTRLEETLGPSCLLSLVIVVLLLVAFRRLLQLPFPVLALVVIAVWYAVLTLLMRWNPKFLHGDDS